MDKLLTRGLVIVIAMIVIATTTLVFVAIGGSASASCTPTITTIQDGSVKVGSGPATEQYFSQFGENVVAEKKANAALIIQIGEEEGFSTHSIEIAIGTALQESGLRNLTGGDRDSLGLFQQRPSVGSWGTAKEIMDTTHATKAFYAALKRVANRDSLPLIQAAIKVQGPSVEAYERTWHWDTIAEELAGDAGSSSVCTGSSGYHLPLDPGYGVSTTFDDNDPSYVGVKPHSGIDLSNYAGGTLGRPVYAITSGVVVTSGAGEGCSGNNVVTIKQDDGVEAVYMHMNGSDITAKVGDTVTPGEQIGKIGSCGQSTGPHLHFAIEAIGTPTGWLANLQEVQQFGATWLDPVGYMAHYGVTLVPNK